MKNMLKCRELWLIFILGLFVTWNRCAEGRAVNISNTWTLPHDGFKVFYRFFRDKISWFEADAVCQFHHAHLVTIDNTRQFEASRDFLNELDVNENVWIGLMRSQNAENFAWSNSKPLQSTSEYWDEVLPMIESPLCAVVDPMRDFRWHAMRCGGPETASFLCEMNIPNWVGECIIEGISSLTIQYMADSGTVEISKDCGPDEGSIHHVCKSKKDRDIIAKNLICRNDKAKIFEENSITSTDLADTHHKSMQIISSVATDNNEDNSISINPTKFEEPQTTEKNPVQRVIEQFSVEELMQADQPQDQKQEKKPGKKTKFQTKKEKALTPAAGKKQKKLKGGVKSMPEEEMMMGDQPAGDINSLNEHLPHIKKSFPQDIKHNHDTTAKASLSSSTETISAETTELKVDLTETSSFSSPVNAETEESFRSTVATPKLETVETTTLEALSSTTTSTTTTTTTPAFTTAATEELRTPRIAHPMGPKQSSSRGTPQPPPEIEDVSHAIHVKEFSGSNVGDDHFIPPMLLVKSHYTSTKSHMAEQTSVPSPSRTSTHTSTVTEKIDITTEKVVLHEESTSQSHPPTKSISALSTAASENNQAAVVTIPTAHNESLPLSGETTTLSLGSNLKINLSPSSPGTHRQSEKIPPTEGVATTTVEPSSAASVSNSNDQHQVVEIKISSSDNPTTFSITTRQPIPALSSTTASPSSPISNTVLSSEASVTSFSQTPNPTIPAAAELHGGEQINILHHKNADAEKEIPATLQHSSNHLTPHSSSSSHQHHENDNHHAHSGEFASSEENHSIESGKNKFSNEENYQPYKPNRHRILTKPETPTYLHKILG